MKKSNVDLNADMGEYADDEQEAVEKALMPLITSCSIACGGHAGNDATMRATARLAREHRVSIGAHPSYPDRESFGRRPTEIDDDALRSAITAQITSLRRILDQEGAQLRHVKPHGALYNDAARDIALAEIIADAAGDAVIVGPPRSALEVAALKKARTFAAEGFVDRLYLASGELAPRTAPGAVIESIDARAAQALALARGEQLVAKDGAVSLNVKTLCIHSDTPAAIETATAVRSRLEADGFSVRAFG